MLLRRLAQTAAVALGNLRVFVEEHRTALTLQRSLLPASLPPLPGLAVAARYKASGDQVEVGGDFYDAFRTDDGRSVGGDRRRAGPLAGGGDRDGRAALLAARVHARRARRARRARAGSTAILLRGHPDMTATVCMLVFPDGDGDVEVANAGHIPPLVVRDGTAAYLDPTGPLLGIETPAGHRGAGSPGRAAAGSC